MNSFPILLILWQSGHRIAFSFVVIRFKKTPVLTGVKKKAMANKMVKASSKAKEID